MRYLLCLLAACSTNPETEHTETTEETPEPVSASVQLLDVMGGKLPEGINVTGELESIVLDNKSAGSLAVPADAQFYLEVETEDFYTHHLTGMAGQSDLSLVSFFASRETGDLMYGMLGLEQDPAKGILIVALDHPDLSPAFGAAATIDANHDGAFVTTNFGVKFSNVVESSGFVAFPNVETGETTISVTPPEDETCWFHAVGGEGATVDIRSDEATVAFFVCE